MQALFVAGHKSDKVWSELVVLPMQAVVVGQLTKEGQVTLVVKGSMGVMIRREGQVGWLVKPGAAEWQERNGKYREGDKWFIGTAELFQALGAATISAELDGRSGEDLQAAIATKMRQQA